MKRFITYLYAYKDGKKKKNTGHIRVDVKGYVLDMQVNIKESEVSNLKGDFYIIVKKDKVSSISFAEILMRNELYNGRIVCSCKEQGFTLEDIIGVSVVYENGDYMASCWKDGEEECVAEVLSRKNDRKENLMVVETISEPEETDRSLEAASCEIEANYREINLSELHSLPSQYWHFSNNSFLLHGFWNYGYLVLKESLAENDKRIALGVPGIFEEPERIMATYFGFSTFEVLPPSEKTTEVEQKNQQPKEGSFGCWFVNL